MASIRLFGRNSNEMQFTKLIDLFIIHKTKNIYKTDKLNSHTIIYLKYHLLFEYVYEKTKVSRSMVKCTFNPFIVVCSINFIY